jgi:XapX domain-containing protein
MAYALSLAMGLVVGLLYALVGIRSPAPPLIALVGLLGIVIGEGSAAFVKQRMSPTPNHIAAAPTDPREGR